jgi:CheY-like chemotaxis protein
MRDSRTRSQVLYVAPCETGLAPLAARLGPAACAVTHAPTCRDAQVIDFASPCDLLVVDADGSAGVGLAAAVDLLAEIRLRQCRRVPALVLVSSARPDHAEAALEAGFDAARDRAACEGPVLAEVVAALADRCGAFGAALGVGAARSGLIAPA